MHFLNCMQENKKTLIRMRDMKPVQSSLKKWMQENENFKERHLQMKKETLNDPKIQRFLSSHPNLSEQEIDVNLNKLYEYKRSEEHTSELQSRGHLVCRLLLEIKKIINYK